MTSDRRKCARPKLHFPKAQAAQPVLERLLQEELESAVLLRGRMTNHDAWHEVETPGLRDQFFPDSRL